MRSTEAQAGCMYEIERMDENICFIRLDFEKFEVAPPDVVGEDAGGLCTVDQVSFT